MGAVSNGAISNPTVVDPEPFKPGVLKSFFQISTKRLGIDKVLKREHKNYRLAAMNIISAFSKSPNRRPEIEHNICGVVEQRHAVTVFVTTLRPLKRRCCFADDENASYKNNHSIFISL